MEPEAGRERLRFASGRSEQMPWSETEDDAIISSGVDCSATLVCWNGIEQQPVIPSRDLYENHRPSAIAARQRLLYNLHLTPLTSEYRPSLLSSHHLPTDFKIFAPLSPLKCPLKADPSNTELEQICGDICDENTTPKENKQAPKRKSKDPTTYLSLQSFDSIHTASILCWRRGRYAYIADLNIAPDNDDDDNEWRTTESIIFILYRLVGCFVLVSQFTFLWSLLDMYAFEFTETDSREKAFPIKYTASMADNDFGPGPLNATIAAWDASRPAANARQCEDWILECGARWASGQACAREADISSSCPPWDYETFLQGRNGSRPICYRSEGAAVLGGRPYYGSMTKGVILEWVFGCAAPRPDRVRAAAPRPFGCSCRAPSPPPAPSRAPRREAPAPPPRGSARGRAGSWRGRRRWGPVPLMGPGEPRLEGGEAVRREGVGGAKQSKNLCGRGPARATDGERGGARGRQARAQETETGRRADRQPARGRRGPPRARGGAESGRLVRCLRRASDWAGVGDGGEQQGVSHLAKDQSILR
jgi:hypothetical protein